MNIEFRLKGCPVCKSTSFILCESRAVKRGNVITWKVVFYCSECGFNMTFVRKIDRITFLYLTKANLVSFKGERQVSIVDGRLILTG